MIHRESQVRWHRVRDALNTLVLSDQMQGFQAMNMNCSRYFRVSAIPTLSNVEFAKSVAAALGRGWDESKHETSLELTTSRHQTIGRLSDITLFYGSLLNL